MASHRSFAGSFASIPERLLQPDDSSITETDQLAGMPPDLEYIRPVVMKYTRSGRTEREKWQATVDRLGIEQVAEIAAVYRALIERDHVEHLSAWIGGEQRPTFQRWELWYEANEELQRAGQPTAPEPQQRPRAHRLFELFEYLASKRMKPFNSGRVEYRPPAIRLDWSILPPELEYLRKPAGYWGRLYADEQWYWVGKLLGRLGRRKLRKLFDKMQRPDDQRLIKAFMAQYLTIEYRPEAICLMNLQFLLGHLFSE